MTFVKMVAFFPLLHDRVFWGNAALNGLVIKKVGEIKVSVKRIKPRTQKIAAQFRTFRKN